MSFKSSSLLCLSLLLALSSAIQGFDITKLLGQYSEFGLFNQYITETKLADQINNRNTITILAVDDSSLSALSGKSQDVIKAIISTHVILDYFDEKKLMSVEGSHTQLATLYQASGLATNMQGFIVVALINEGEIAFGSAVKGAAFNTKLVKTVTTQPYNISILQVSEPIIAPGIVDAKSPSPAPGAGAKTPLPSKKPTAPAPSAGAGAGAKTPLPSKKPTAPAPSAGAKTPLPSKKPTAPPPSEETIAEAPEVAEAPEPEAKTPAAAPVSEESAAADESQDAPASSSSSRTQMGLVGAVMASLLVAL